jgi:hypothetical protein
MITKFNTKAIREGYQTTNEQEHSEAIFLTSSFKSQLRCQTYCVKPQYDHPI